MKTPAQECFHCGLPIPKDADYRVRIDGQERLMCCRGCQAVAQAIVEGGLEDFYRHRTGPTRQSAERVPEVLQELTLYDRPEVQRRFVRTSGEHLKEGSLILEGIVCAACIWLNERHVSALPGVIEFSVNYSNHRARVVWDDARLQLSDILAAIAAIGYVAHPFDPGRQEEVYRQERRQALRRLAVAGIGMMQVMMFAVALYAGAYEGMEAAHERFLRWVSLIVATPVVGYAARPFFTSAWRDLRRRQLGMDVPVALALGSAFATSLWATWTGGGEVYFDSVCMFTFFLLTGRFLEMGARHKAGQAAEALVRLLPAMATRLTEAGEEVVPVADLKPGDRVIIKPGDTVPADGQTLAGMSSVDESLLTGESLPQSKAAGDRLVGGTVNVESPLTMKVEQVGEDTVLSAIQRLLDRAQTEKPHLAQMADRVAGWFVAALLLVAAAVAVGWWQHSPEDAFWVTLSVLVVTCPCALSLATPAAMTAATGTLARLGILTTRGHALETLARATHGVFDKTGTLTEGRLQVDQVIPMAEMSRERCLQVAAALEQGSEHPVATALRAQVSPLAEPVEEQRVTPGQGIEGRLEGTVYRVGTPEFVAALSGEIADPRVFEVTGSGASWVALGGERGLLGLFSLQDRLRGDARETVQGLQVLGMEVWLLSGDQPGAVEKVARQLGIAHAESRLTPQDKLERLQRLQAQGAIVVMVGDGVNDAPVLAAAQVSLAMGGGTQLAQASADMVLLSDRLAHLLAGVRMARRSLRVIRENLLWALIYNLVALPLAAGGHIAPWMAALGMSASSLLVVVNALRLTRLRVPLAPIQEYNEHARVKKGATHACRIARANALDVSRPGRGSR